MPHCTGGRRTRKEKKKQYIVPVSYVAVASWRPTGATHETPTMRQQPSPAGRSTLPTASRPQSLQVACRALPPASRPPRRRAPRRPPRRLSWRAAHQTRRGAGMADDGGSTAGSRAAPDTGQPRRRSQVFGALMPARVKGRKGKRRGATGSGGGGGGSLGRSSSRSGGSDGGDNTPLTWPAVSPEGERMSGRRPTAENV